MGCKDIQRFIDGSESKSFTLTMWDVKFLLDRVSKAAVAGFTLTMWDVK